VNSVRENILAAMTAALNGATAPATFYRSRADALGAEELPAGVLMARHETGQRVSANVSLRKLTVRVEVQIAAAAPVAGEPPFAADSQFDALLVYCVQTLCQSAAVRAAGVKSIDNSAIDFEVAPAAQDIAAVAVDFEVEFAVRANDPTAVFTQ